MKFRNLAALFTGAALALSLTACGGGTSAPSGGDSSPAEEGGSAVEEAAPSGGDKVTLVLSQRDEWLSTLVDGAQAAAAEAGVSLTVVDCQSDASKGIQFVETARNAGEKGVIVNLVDPAQATAILEAAGDMKVVFVNRPPEDMGVLNENVVYVGSDEMTSGKYQGEALVEYFNNLGQTDVKYILLNGILGQVSTTNRTASVLQALADGGLNATEASAPLACDYDRATAMDLVTPLLTSGVEYDCVISNNDAMALGVIEAMKTQGIDPSAKPIVGIDCTPDGAAAVAAGEMYMTVFQNADGQGRGSVNAIVNLINGNPIEQNTGYEPDADNQFVLWVPFEPVDASNVADYQ